MVESEKGVRGGGKPMSLRIIHHARLSAQARGRNRANSVSFLFQCGFKQPFIAWKSVRQLKYAAANLITFCGFSYFYFERFIHVQ